MGGGSRDAEVYVSASIICMLIGAGLFDGTVGFYRDDSNSEN